MSFLALVVVSISRAPWDFTVPLSDCRPSLVPKIAKNARFEGSRALTEGFRGFTSIDSTWVISKPIGEAIRSLRSEFGDLESAISTRGGYSFVRDLEDRRVTVAVSHGYTEPWVAGKTYRRERLSKDTKTTLTVTEQALSEGPLPKHWPAKATRLLSSWPSPPHGSRRHPDHWTVGPTSSGAPAYRLTWYVKGNPGGVHTKVSSRFPGWQRSRGYFDNPANLYHPATSALTGLKGRAIVSQALFIGDIRVSSLKDQPNGPWTAVRMSWIVPGESPYHRVRTR